VGAIGKPRNLHLRFQRNSNICQAQKHRNCVENENEGFVVYRMRSRLLIDFRYSFGCSYFDTNYGNSQCFFIIAIHIISYFTVPNLISMCELTEM
jgi:hypothetical protein